MGSNQRIEGLGDSDTDLQAFLERLKTTADALDAALHAARRFRGPDPRTDTRADLAA